MKPARRSDPPPTSHVFVHYTHPSQRHHKEQRFAIQSHVSGNYRRKNKQIVLPSSRTRQWHVPERKTQGIPSLTRQFKDNDHDGAAFKYPASFSKEFQSDHLICCPQRDPFDAYPIQARDCVPAAFDYYIKVFAPAHASVCGTNNAYLTKLLPLAMQNPVLFEGLIALSQCHLAANYHLTCPNKEALYHRGQALKLLRNRVSSLKMAPDDAVIWTSVLLLGIDRSRVVGGAHEWRFRHDKAERRPSSNRSDIAYNNFTASHSPSAVNSPSLIIELTKQTSSARSMWTLATDKASIPDDPAFDTSVISKPLSPNNLESSIQHLPAGFRALALTKRLRQPILEMLSKLYSDAGNIRLHPNEATRLYDSFRETPDDSLDEPIYLAVLIYFFNVYGRPRGCLTYLRTLQKLAGAVTHLRPSDGAESDCLVWILTVAGAGAERTNWEDRVPFMSHMLQRFPETRGRARWRRIVQRFFWDEVQGREWEEVWTGAMEVFAGGCVSFVACTDCSHTDGLSGPCGLGDKKPLGAWELVEAS